jgi:GT2 family glycosyltransferase
VDYPVVFAILVAFNQREETVATLRSLLGSEYPSLHAIVVDNGSTDDTVDFLVNAFAEVIVLANGRNLGFAEGCNVGMRRALVGGAEFVLLLNSDVVLAPDTLAILVDAAQSDPRIGIAGPKVYRWDTPTILQSAGGIIDWTEVRSVLIGDGEQDLGQYDASREVDFVSGSALLARRAVLEQVGLMDPRYFMYYEEVDWCWRTGCAGFRVVCIPRARVWHKDRTSSAGNPYLVNYFTTRNRLFFGTRYASYRGKAYLGIDSLLMLMRAVINLGRRERCGWSRAVALGILDFCLSRFGPGSYLAVE